MPIAVHLEFKDKVMDSELKAKTYMPQADTFTVKSDTIIAYT